MPRQTLPPTLAGFGLYPLIQVEPPFLRFFPMASKLTLNKLAENLIRESNVPFTAEDFLNRIKERWRRKISPSTLADLRQKLVNHDFLIGMETNDYLPYKAVLERLGSIPISVLPGNCLSIVPKDRSISASCSR